MKPSATQLLSILLVIHAAGNQAQSTLPKGCNSDNPVRALQNHATQGASEFCRSIVPATVTTNLPVKILAPSSFQVHHRIGLWRLISVDPSRLSSSQRQRSQAEQLGLRAQSQFEERSSGMAHPSRRLRKRLLRIPIVCRAPIVRSRALQHHHT